MRTLSSGTQTLSILSKYNRPTTFLSYIRNLNYLTSTDVFKTVRCYFIRISYIIYHQYTHITGRQEVQRQSISFSFPVSVLFRYAFFSD